VTRMNPLEHDFWNDLVTASEGYSFFHSSNWAKVLNESYGYSPVYIGSAGESSFRTLVPAMEVRSILTGTRGVSLPFTDYCNPIGGPENELQNAFDFLVDYGRRAHWRYVELRGLKYFEKDVPGYNAFYHHELQLTEDEESMASAFEDYTRRNIKKAERLGLVAEFSKTLDAVKEFYRLHCMTRKLHGMPPQPFSFFRNVHEYVIAKGFGVVVLVKYEGRNIAGAVFFHLGEQVIFKYSASDRRYQSLRPNNILVWAAINRFAKNGYKSLSFGRTEMSGEGLRRFKNSWGAREEIIKYYHYDLAKNSFVTLARDKTEAYDRIFNKMPVPLLRITGALLYRHMG